MQFYANRKCGSWNYVELYLVTMKTFDYATDSVPTRNQSRAAILLNSDPNPIR